MIDGQRICVVMPAYNAAATLEQTYRDIPEGSADRVIGVLLAACQGLLHRLGLATPAFLSPEGRRLEL